MTTIHFADRWFEAVRRKGSPVCVGLDPVWNKLPAELRSRDPRAADERLTYRAEQLAKFCAEVIDVVRPHVPAVKINIAFFEPYQEAGWRAYRMTIAAAHRAGLIVIGDIKRGDIGHTAESYAAAHLDESLYPQDEIADAVTINPYFGTDGVQPFIRLAAAGGRGVFILAQTSNPSAREIQGVQLQDGRQLVDMVADKIAAWSREAGETGSSGFGPIGAVVSPADMTVTRRLRMAMPHSLFLVPGFGAQGRTTGEVAACFHPDGRGAIVASSRGVVFAFDDPRYRPVRESDWRDSVERAARDFARDVREAVRGPHS